MCLTTHANESTPTAGQPVGPVWWIPGFVKNYLTLDRAAGVALHTEGEQAGERFSCRWVGVIAAAVVMIALFGAAVGIWVSQRAETTAPTGTPAAATPTPTAAATVSWEKTMVDVNRVVDEQNAYNKVIDDDASGTDAGHQVMHAATQHGRDAMAQVSLDIEGLPADTSQLPQLRRFVAAGNNVFDKERVVVNGFIACARSSHRQVCVNKMSNVMSEAVVAAAEFHFATKALTGRGLS